MNYNRDEVRKLEREIEETSGNRFRPYRVGGWTVNEDLVVRIAEKWGYLIWNAHSEMTEDHAGVNAKVESAIREALLEMADTLDREALNGRGLEFGARLIREVARDAE